MITYIILALFFAAAVLNLIGARKHNAVMSNASKPALLSLLCLYCLSVGFPEPDLLLIGALFACFVGDVLLILEKDLWFTLGGVSFFIGHVLLTLIFIFRTDLSSPPLLLMIPAAAVYAAASSAVMVRTKKRTPKAMFVPMLLYLLCNSATNVFALTRLTVSPGVGSALSYAGAVLFFLSDCALFLMRYGDEKKRFYKTDFFVMLTYICGVSLITLGLCPFWS